jgi:hypothetical protein
MGKWNKPSVIPMISLRKKSVRDIRKETKFLIKFITKTPPFLIKKKVIKNL